MRLPGIPTKKEGAVSCPLFLKIPILYFELALFTNRSTSSGLNRQSLPTLTACSSPRLTSLNTVLVDTPKYRATSYTFVRR